MNYQKFLSKLWIAALILSLSCLLSGCASTRSGLSYSKGTEHLEQENYEEAIIHLENATSLCPELSRNHTSLSAAYLGNGNLEDAWYSSRKAVICRQRDGKAYAGFFHLYKTLVIEPGLNKPGTPLPTVLDKLGAPDSTTSDGETVSAQYGCMIMEFVDDALVRCYRMKGM